MALYNQDIKAVHERAQRLAEGLYKDDYVSIEKLRSMTLQEIVDLIG